MKQEGKEGTEIADTGFLTLKVAEISAPRPPNSQPPMQNYGRGFGISRFRYVAIASNGQLFRYMSYLR